MHFHATTTHPQTRTCISMTTCRQTSTWIKEYEELLAHSRLREAIENRSLATLCMRNSRMENVPETTPDKGLGGRTKNLEEILLPEEELQRQFKENDLIEAIKSMEYLHHY